MVRHVLFASMFRYWSSARLCLLIQHWYTVIWSHYRVRLKRRVPLSMDVFVNWDHYASTIDGRVHLFVCRKFQKQDLNAQDHFQMIRSWQVCCMYACVSLKTIYYDHRDGVEAFAIREVCDRLKWGCVLKIISVLIANAYVMLCNQVTCLGRTLTSGGRIIPSHTYSCHSYETYFWKDSGSSFP